MAAYTMSAISELLDAKLKTLDARAASSLEKLARDTLALVNTQNGAARPGRLPPDFLRALPPSLAANLSSGLRKVTSRSVRDGNGLPTGDQRL